ncbi:multiple antibiotic resistance protein MarB [Escherichia coli]|nr:multiple antibiotic resistance protein MarB [Escherichia coli]EHB7627930.1 multiple antibiotic resistance protein MarB [Escherichia coli]
MPFRSLERGWRRGATRSSYRGRDQAGATDVILDIKRLLLSPGNTSILPENIVGQSLSVGFRPLPQTTPVTSCANVVVVPPSQEQPPFDLNHMGTGSDKSDALGVPYYNQHAM